MHLKQTFHSDILLHCLSGLGEFCELVKFKDSEFVIASSMLG